MSNRFEIIPFHQHQILTVRTDTAVLVVMKPIVEVLGLDWRAQQRRIASHPVIATGMALMAIPSAGGMQETLALDLEQFHGWLITLTPDRIKDEAKREMIIRYQREAFRVIFEHFHGGGQRGVARAALSSNAERNLMVQIEKLKRETNPVARDMLGQMILRNCDAIGLDAPDIDRLINPDAGELMRADLWLATAADMMAAGTLTNHHRKPELVAISLREAASSGLRADAVMKAVFRRHPRFISAGSVNCSDGMARHCWVFRSL